MAYLKGNERIKRIVILLGPSGSGKTTFGETYSSTGSSMFFSTGDKLREENYISPWHEPNIANIKEYCHELMAKTFLEFHASESDMLILDCVKDLEDAEFVTAQAEKHGLSITRALLFDVNEKQLGLQWQQRARNTDMLRMIHGSVNEYLYRWKSRSNDVINYYTNLQVLYKLPAPSFIQLLRDFVTCTPPSNLQFMLLNSEQIKNVFMSLHSLLNIIQFQFSLPTSFVHSYRDVKWIANPTRYYVTAKADGVRCLLLKISSGTYLITRKHEIYPCHIPDDQLPENTVLDGELLPSTSMSEIHPKMNTLQLKTSVFLAFDALAVSGEILWKWPFTLRLESLGGLSLRRDVVAIMKQASTNDQFSATLGSSPNNQTLTVYCTMKGHRQSTTEDILRCLDTEFPYSCDGLIFTPDKAYVFGPDPLMFKWQCEEDVHGDIRLNYVENPSDPLSNEPEVVVWPLTYAACSDSVFADFDKCEVFECRWNQTINSWEPLFARHDKAMPNADNTIAHLKKMCRKPFSKDYLLCSLIHLRNFDKHKDEGRTSKLSGCGHPTNTLSFDELYSNLNELVQLGDIQKTVDLATGLEIFSCRALAAFSSPMMAHLSRGLVLHPLSKKVVTKPFVKFYEVVSNHEQDEIVEATIKYDGSLGIAFLWNGDVMVTTKRRMNSEQAVWANQWIIEHCNLTAFQAGCTYLFEIIYQNNTVVVNYLFEGLVLLAITNESGYELPYEETLHCARVIGFFMIAPRITGEYSEVLWYCGGIESSQETVTPGGPNWPPFTSGALPISEGRQEGWVVKFKDGVRQKIVYKWWKNVSKLADLVHPQIIWLLLKHDKITEVFGNVPNHFKTEIRRMVQAIGRRFEETLRLVESIFKVERPNSEDISDSLCHVNEWSDAKVKRMIDDLVGKNDHLRQLLTEIKPDLPALGVYEGTERDSDVNTLPFYHHLKRNFLRLPILNYICPAFPELEGYEPIDNFRQTWCKGWARQSFTHEWQFVQAALQENDDAPPFLQLPVEIIVMILLFLDHASLTALAKVCVYLRKIVKSCKTNHLFLEKLIKPDSDIYKCEFEYKYSWLNNYNYNRYDSW